jgi:hypothetical protein
VYDRVEIQVFFPFETFEAHRANVGTLGVVTWRMELSAKLTTIDGQLTKFMPFQMLLSLQSSTANVADVPGMKRQLTNPS